MSDHLARYGHLVRTTTGHLSRSCSGGTWMIPKNCLTGVSHPTAVVAAVDSLRVFTISGPGDCWYVNESFTELDDVPVGRSVIPASDEYPTCDDCLAESIPSSGTSCCLSIGDTAMMHYNYQNVNPALCPDLVTSGSVSAIYTTSGWVSTPSGLSGPATSGALCGKRGWTWSLPAGGSITMVGNCCVATTIEYLACGGKNSHDCFIGPELSRQIVASLSIKRLNCRGPGLTGCVRGPVKCEDGACS